MRKLMIVLLVISFARCTCDPSAADSAALKHVREEFGSRYSFDVDCVSPGVPDVYLNATAEPGTRVSRQDSVKIAQRFWLRDGAVRADSELVYLNVYDANRRFQFQTVWNPASKSFAFNTTEHY